MSTLKEIKDRYKEHFGLKRLTEKIEYYDNDIMIVSFYPVRYAFDKNFKRIKLKSRFKVYHILSLIDFMLLDELNEQKYDRPIIITANYIQRIKKKKIIYQPLINLGGFKKIIMEKFARVCSYTNQPINEGFYISEEYVADTKEAKELFMAECKEYNSWDEMMEEEYSDACYYTEWEIDEEYYFDENGNLIEQSN